MQPRLKQSEQSSLRAALRYRFRGLAALCNPRGHLARQGARFISPTATTSLMIMMGNMGPPGANTQIK